MSEFFKFVIDMLQGTVNAINSVTIDYTNQFGTTYSFKIFYMLFAILVVSIVVSFFVKGAKG